MANARGFYSRSSSYIIVLSLIGLLFISVLFLSGFKTNCINQEKPGLIVTSPFVPEKVEFCGENIPIEYFDVFESLEKELIVNTFYHSQTILYIKKANRYFPVIENILKKNNITDDFKYLAVAESGLSNVVSPANATGFWQLLKGTAEGYNLEVNDEVDERYHLEKSTEAACKFLQQSYNKYNNWVLVAASYNVGRRGVNRQIERQGETDYFDLMFNEETARYVYRIVAIKLILENPASYGFHFEKNELYKPSRYKLVTVSKPVSDWGEFARANGTNYKLLKFLNPWLRDKTLSNKYNKEYLIKIPTSRIID
jgi:hypothetical protein